MSINKVIISGNLTREPQMRATAGGTQILGFGVAVNDRRKNPATGEWEDYPNFVDCAMFGARAEAVSRYLSKGSKVAIEGKLRYSSWERDGQRRSKLEVIVDEIEFLSRQPDAYAPQGGYAPQAPQQAPKAPQSGYAPQQAPQRPQWSAQDAYQNPPAAPQRPQHAPQAPQAPQRPPQAPQQPAMDVYDGDIPF